MNNTPHASLARDGIPEPHYRLRWWTLAVLTLSLVLVVMESASLNVAIPTLVRELGASDTELQWMVDLYTLVFGALLLTMGAVGDRFGRKGALQAGLVIFGLTSLATALFARDAPFIIVGRGIMGVGGALVMPATLSILTRVFPREERGKAIGIWAAFAGLGAPLGQISSGVLLEYFGWQSVFWTVVPIVALALLAGVRFVPKSRDPALAPLDVVGGVLSVVALGGLLYAIIEGPNAGWMSPPILGVGALSLVVAVVFVWWERRNTHPMLPLEFFSDRGFSAGNVVIASVFFCAFATFFVITQYLQFVQSFSPLEAGVRFLPLGVGLIVGSPYSARLLARVGAAPTVASGLLLVSGALASLAMLGSEDQYWRLGVALFVAGLGIGLSMPPATTVVMASVPAGKAGIGSSMGDTSRQVGGAFGVAILGSLLKASYVSQLEDVLPAGLTAAQRAAAEAGLGGALAVAAGMGPQGAALAQAAREAFVGAMAPAFWLAVASVMATVAFVVLFFPRGSDTQKALANTAVEFDGAVRLEPRADQARGESIDEEHPAPLSRTG